MKKFLFILLAHSAIALPATRATAQEAATDHEAKSSIGLPASMPQNSAHSLHYSAGVSDRVQKKFDRTFGAISDAVWTKTNNGFFVQFSAGGIKNRVFLTKRGHHEWHIRDYSEKELPANVRHQVKGTYYDFAIRAVHEVHGSGATVYLIIIADATTWKMIRVIDGEMDEWKAYQKA